MSEPTDPLQDPVVIKKYANRRLYSRASRGYVTLEHLADMVREGNPFIVEDAKTGEDITHTVLTHVVFDEETKGGPAMMPVSVLRQLITFYGSNMQQLLPAYLDYAMQVFVHNQEVMRHYMDRAFSGLDPFGQFEAMGKRNIAMFEQTMKVFQATYTDGHETDDGSEEEVEDGDDMAPTGDRARSSADDVADR